LGARIARVQYNPDDSHGTISPELSGLSQPKHVETIDLINDQCIIDPKVKGPIDR
jgi:hypothetical protein